MHMIAVRMSLSAVQQASCYKACAAAAQESMLVSASTKSQSANELSQGSNFSHYQA